MTLELYVDFEMIVDLILFMGDLHLTYCLLYLDDIIIYSRTYEEHIDRLKRGYKGYAVLDLN